MQCAYFHEFFSLCISFTDMKEIEEKDATVVVAVDKRMFPRISLPFSTYSNKSITGHENSSCVLHLALKICITVCTDKNKVMHKNIFVTLFDLHDIQNVNRKRF